MNAPKQNRSVSTVGAGRVKSIGPIRTGMRGGVVSMMCAVVLSVVEHYWLSSQPKSILRLMR